MTFERSHGKVRLARPRLSDVNDGTEPQRSPERDAKGRAAHGNQLASGRGWKRALSATLPDTPDARKLYNGAVRELVFDTPFARAACAAWVRHVLREAELDAAAVKAGVGTPKGMKLLASAVQHGEKAERAATAVLTFTRRKSPPKSAKKANTPSKAGELRAAIAEENIT